MTWTVLRRLAGRLLLVGALSAGPACGDDNGISLEEAVAGRTASSPSSGSTSSSRPP